MKITPADKWFSLCVRERADWRCEKCGKKFPHDLDTRSGLDCHHLITRDNWAVRFEPLNGVALCVHDHRSWAEGNPFEVTEWAEEKLGDNYMVLRKKSDLTQIGKVARKSNREMAKHYKAQYAAMQTARSAGAVGRLEFFGWL